MIARISGCSLSIKALKFVVSVVEISDISCDQRMSDPRMNRETVSYYRRTSILRNSNQRKVCVMRLGNSRILFLSDFSFSKSSIYRTKYPSDSLNIAPVAQSQSVGIGAERSRFRTSLGPTGFFFRREN